MNTQRRFSSLALSLLCLSTLPGAGAYAQKSSPSYTFTDLGGLSGWSFKQSQALAINDAGQIAGWSLTVGPTGQSEEHAVVWAKDATGKYVMTDLGRGHATGINNNGEVLARGTLIQPVTINGHMVWYQDLNGDGFNDLAIPLVVGGSALNDNTQIVAGYNIMTFVAGNQVVTPLPGYGTGNAINNNGQVAGYSGGIANGTFPAAIWQTDAAGNLLGAVFLNGQAGSSAATAMCLDQLGNAAGRSEFPVPNSMPPALRFRATLWKNAGPPIDLGAPSRSSSQVQGASTINGALQLVGWVSNGSSYAFLWQNGKLTDLNTLVSVSGSLREADAINANGQIVGVARVPVGKSDYEAHAFLITPK